MSKKEIQLYIAALGGAFLLVIADLMSNIDAATTLKLGGVLEKHVIGATDLGPGLIGLMLVLIFSAFFCWLYNPEDKVAAFTRGFSVFAVLSAVTPYSALDDGLSTKQTFSKLPSINKEINMIPLISSAYAEEIKDGMACRSGTLEPDSTLISDKYVSSCKPYYSGFLGLGSFFNNTIEYCPPKYKLPKNERVKLLKSWETGLRDYRYSQIEFEIGEQICTGWVSDGRKAARYVIHD